MPFFFMFIHVVLVGWVILSGMLGIGMFCALMGASVPGFDKLFKTWAWTGCTAIGMILIYVIIKGLSV